MLFVKLLFAVIILTLVLTIIGSFIQCLNKTEAWQREVTVKLNSLFEMEIWAAKGLVDLHFPLMSMALKEHPHPDIAANMIFWSPEVQNNIRAVHFQNEVVPMHLYTIDNYGRVTLEA